MISLKLALLRNFLLVPVALALGSPSSPLGASLARRGDPESLQSLSLSGVESRTIYNTVQSSSWAGVRVHADDGDHITYVTGTFITPTLRGDNSSAMIWVGLDGEGCQNGAVRAGINLFMNRGVFSYSVWYQVVASGVYPFPGITVSAGDYITVTIVAANTSWGVVVMDNLTAHQSFALDVFPQALGSICQENAEWIVSSPLPDSFANFDNVPFTLAMASGTGNTTYTPSEPASAVTLYNIVSQHEKDRFLLTFVSVAGPSLLVQRLSG